MLDDKERLAGYHLGLWLLGDQQRAEMAVSRAADKVSIADINAAANWKRTERNRARNPNGHRPNYRVRSQVFTRLLLTELEHEEKEQEKEIALTEKDCVQRSVKLLFRVSIEHNPFWAAVISCLVLGTPSARQTLSVYGAVAPDPEEKKDEPRCSRVKGSIIKLMAGRFGVRVEEVLHPDSSPLPTSDPRVSLIGGSFAKLLPLIDGDDVDLDRMRVFFDINRFNQVTHTLQLTSFEKCVRKLLIWDVLGARMPQDRI